MNEEFYLDHITSAHCDKPKYMAWLKALLSPVLTVGETVEEFIRAFSVEHSEGVQLDIVGKIVGADRKLPFDPIGEDVSPYLSDEDYRRYIKAKIIFNVWNGTNETLPSLWTVAFPDLKMTYTDGQDMTMTVRIVGKMSEVFDQLIQAGLVIPVPAGVGISYTHSQEDAPVVSVDKKTGVFASGGNTYGGD